MCSSDLYSMCMSMDHANESIYLFVYVKTMKWVNASHADKWMMTGETPLLYPVYLDKYLGDWIENCRKRWPLMNKVCMVDLASIVNIHEAKEKPEILPDTEHDREWTYEFTEAVIKVADEEEKKHTQDTREVGPSRIDNKKKRKM